jgi:hypothetical protein
MPLSVADVLPRLKQVCVNGATHPDYARTVLLAERYRRLATGAGIGQDMRRLASRETEAQFQSRLGITTETVSASWNQARTPFYETARLRGGTVTKRFDYEESLPVTEAQRLTDRLTTAVNGYYNRKPLENYLAERLVKSHCMSDPNAWLLTEFAPFDFRTQVAQPYPVLVPCEAAVDFGRQAGTVSYFVARFVVPGYPSSFRYCCYLDEVAVDCWPVIYDGQNPIYTLPEGSAVAQEFTDDAQQGRVLYQCRILNNKPGRVPASVLGYVVDEEGTGETFVSPLHAGLPFLLQMLKVGSENDIVMSQMALPIRLAYARDCPGSVVDGQLCGCKGGMNPKTLEPCGTCGGIGTLPVPITAAETLTMPFPKDGDDPKVKPADLLSFSGPPTDNPKLQLEYLESRRQLFMQAIHGRVDADRVAGSKTATERQIELQAELTAQAPFADQFAALWVWHATVTASYVDAAKGLKAAVYEFPPDLERISEEDLYILRKLAVDSGADASTLEAIDARIATKQFADDPDALNKNLVKRRFITFLGYTNAEVNALYAQGGMRKIDWIARTNADIIFGELEIDYPNFYHLAYGAQVPLVQQKIADIISALPASSASMPRMNLSPVPAPTVSVAA